MKQLWIETRRLMENAKYASARVYVHAYVHVASSSRYGESLRHACTGDVRTQGVLWLWQQRKTQNIVTGVTIKISAFLETVTIVSPCMHVHTYVLMYVGFPTFHPWRLQLVTRSKDWCKPVSTTCIHTYVYTHTVATVWIHHIVCIQWKEWPI